MVLALLLGLAAGWLLRGRQGARVSGQGPSVVEGDPVAGLAVVATPTPAATTDEARPAATVDSAPAAVADEPTPVDTVSAPAAVTTPDGSAPADAPSAVDPADMALTDAPPAGPDDADLRPEPAAQPEREPAAVDERSAPVIAPRRPADDLTSTDAPHADIAPTESSAIEVPPADTTPVESTEADAARAEATPVETAAAEVRPADTTTPVDTTPAGTTDGDAARAEATPVEATEADAAPVTGAAANGEAAEPVRATPPVRPTATPPVRPAADTTLNGTDTGSQGPADDFRRIQGVGPKMAAALQAAGVRTYGQLGELDEAALRDLIRAAGLRAAPGLASWPQQARVLAGAGDEVAAVLPGGSQA
nr:hypothetical protein [Micromonospora acroterricola]